MIAPATLIASADEIDNRLGPIPGRSSDRIARELRKAAERIRDLETAKVSIDVDCLTGGDGHRVFGRVVDFQPEDYEAGGAGKGIGVRLLCEYESNNFGMQPSSSPSK